ncbi:MAG: DUF2066 domain-containing protein [Gammaproteobacteria bacterium]|nr:DUF2066 domain-containing protein [Gammaproteobacteria bacterium]
MKPFFILALFTLQLIWSVAAAQTVQGLYSANLPVSSQSASVRNKMLSRLLGRVLIKVSGQTNVLNNATIKQGLADALAYTAEFNFSEAGGLRLSARFNEQLVDDLLKSAAVPIWGNTRPTVAIWVAYETANNKRQVVTEQMSNSYASVLTRQARGRGLPVILPLWDLDDRLKVGMTDVWGLFSDKIGLASQRYRADFVIIAKVSRQAGATIKWVVHRVPTSSNAFNSQFSKVISSGRGQYPSTKQALMALVEQSSNFFGHQYSVNTEAKTSSFSFNVSAIDSIEIYAAVTNYLLSLKAVDSLQVSQVNNQIFTFNLNIFGRSDSLIDVISLDKKLLNNPPLLGQTERMFHWAL